MGKPVAVKGKTLASKLLILSLRCSQFGMKVVHLCTSSTTSQSPANKGHIRCLTTVLGEEQSSNLSAVHVRQSLHSSGSPLTGKMEWGVVETLLGAARYTANKQKKQIAQNKTT